MDQPQVYANFASVYDQLMTDINYEEWVDYLRRLFQYFDFKPKSILDLGCGTGNNAIPLAALGYEVTGVDLSPDMLAVAEQKARDRGLNLSLICQDMCELDIPVQFDLVISMVDSFNYLTTVDDFNQALKSAYNVLREGGMLIFDLNTAYKIEEVFGDHTYSLVDEDVCYIWENQYDSDSRLCTMEVTFFVRQENGDYRRFTEIHQERGWSLEEVKKALDNNCFRLLDVFGELALEPADPRDERIFIIAKKL